jgi:single-stranded-DNA-specific exonuclease
MTFEFLESLALLEPYGMNNQPVILYCEARQVWPPKAVSGKHLKLFLEGDGLSLEGIAFNQADRKKILSKHNLKLLIAFTPCLNNYNHKMSIQLLIRDFQVIDEPVNTPAFPLENVIQDDTSL